MELPHSTRNPVGRKVVFEEIRTGLRRGWRGRRTAGLPGREARRVVFYFAEAMAGKALFAVQTTPSPEVKDAPSIVPAVKVLFS